jgi:hypothetical protein
MADAVVPGRFGWVRAAALGALIAATAACTDDPERSCASGGGGEVCLVLEDTGPTLSVHDLQPGSELRITVSGAEDTQRLVVGASGGLDGTLTFIAMTPEGVEADVSAVAADGTPIEGTVALAAP